jgi:hypothetical protein
MRTNCVLTAAAWKAHALRLGGSVSFLMVFATLTAFRWFVP